MIAFVRGILEYKDSNHAIIDVNGVGYKVLIPESTYARLPDVGTPDTKLYTYYYVWNDEVRLYGFISSDDQKVFEASIGVKGVGPSFALNIVSKLSPSQFRVAILEEDIKTFQNIPRISREIAQLLIMNLKKKINKINFSEQAITGTDVRKLIDEAVAALVSLGASDEAAEEAIAKARKVLGETATREELIRLGLRYV